MSDDVTGPVQVSDDFTGPVKVSDDVTGPVGVSDDITVHGQLPDTSERPSIYIQ